MIDQSSLLKLLFKNSKAKLGFSILSFFIFISLFAPFLVGSPTDYVGVPLQPPSFEFYNTDNTLINLLNGQTNTFGSVALLKNNTYEHTYYIDTSENQEIQVKAIGGNDAVKYTNLTLGVVAMHSGWKV